MKAGQTTTTTDITVSGANCPWCLNETLDLLRRQPGVVAVASEVGRCIRVEHEDVPVDRLLEIVRSHLHSDATSSTEHVMVEVDARVAELACCQHHPSCAPVPRPSSGGAQDSGGPVGTSGAVVESPPVMETVLEAATRLRTAGYDADLSATEEGRVRCPACGTDHDPATMVIDEIVRYEGMSNPDDEAILLAVRCDCGRRGLYVSGFGPTASTADIAILPRLR